MLAGCKRGDGDLVRAAASGDYETARRIHFELLPLAQALFTETNPIGIKAALAFAKKIPNEELRMPLTPMTDGNRKRLEQAVRELGRLE